MCKLTVFEIKKIAPRKHIFDATKFYIILNIMVLRSDSNFHKRDKRGGFQAFLRGLFL